MYTGFVFRRKITLKKMPLSACEHYWIFSLRIESLLCRSGMHLYGTINQVQYLLELAVMQLWLFSTELCFISSFWPGLISKYVSSTYKRFNPNIILLNQLIARAMYFLLINFWAFHIPLLLLVLVRSQTDDDELIIIIIN
jgi:hypothetical protein